MDSKRPEDDLDWGCVLDGNVEAEFVQVSPGIFRFRLLPIPGVVVTDVSVESGEEKL